VEAVIRAVGACQVVRGAEMATGCLEMKRPRVSNPLGEGTLEKLLSWAPKVNPLNSNQIKAFITDVVCHTKYALHPHGLDRSDEPDAKVVAGTPEHGLTSRHIAHVK
jgi:hypothetical protein